MRKTLIFLTLFNSFNHSAYSAAKEEILCPLWHLKKVKEKVEAQGEHDKYKHCAVSCLLTLRCFAFEVAQIGIYKELADTVGPGNAELRDLTADFAGIELAESEKAVTDESCISKCHQMFPKQAALCR